MTINLEIKDRALEEKILSYISNRQKEVNELILEALEHFLKKDSSSLKYKIKNPEEYAKTLDFNIKESNPNYKLFEDIENIAEYSKELRKNAWK
jgi:hypothetical protein